MSNTLVMADVETLAQTAINMMTEKGVDALIVTEKNQPIGILTERDVLRRCCPEASCGKVKIKQIMSKPLITVDVNAPLGVALQTMIDKKIRRLLVTENGKKIIGVVTQNDLIKGTLEMFQALDLSLATL